MKQREKEKGIKLCVVIIFFILAVTACGGISNKFISSHAQAIQSEEAKVEVVSYNDIFKSYYEQVVDVVPEENTCTFDEFCTHYYVSEMDLPTYTAAVERILINKDSINAHTSTKPKNAGSAYPHIEISEYLFAGTIAISFTTDTYRFITYAYDLDTDTTMSVHYHSIEL